MQTAVAWVAAAIVSLAMFNSATAQETTVDDVTERASSVVDEAQEQIDNIADQVDRSQQAQETKAGILKPIYQLAEKFSFPAFHWLAFAGMVTGVVSFSLQLLLGKLVVLTRRGFSLTEILSDALGLVLSLVGLVLTTQAAAENSTFTSSAFSVISAAAVGVLIGFVFYLWGQRHELDAVEGRRVTVTRT
jgi:hypothetical protein